jgi:hypothetical protein
MFLVSKPGFAVESLSADEIEFIHTHFLDTDYAKISGSAPDFSCIASDYHVTTVKDFLLSLYGQDFGPYLMLFPESTLEGLVNASHFVKLPNGTALDKDKELALNLPLPNNFVKDKNRFVIDRALLKLGLIKQCGFSLPLNYFGIDAIIPVCLKARNERGDPIYTFIAIQVKAGERVTFEEVLKMQSRLHFVNCPAADDHPSQESKEACACFKATWDLNEIYCNQIALIISLADKYERISANGELFCKDPVSNNPDPRHLLSRIYGSNQVDSLASLSETTQKQWLQCKITTKQKFKSDSCFPPLFAHHFDLNYNVRLFSSLWNETMPADSAAGLRVKRVMLNLRQHRLFCISSLGLESFQHLYADRRRAIETAYQILNPETLIGDTSTIDLENMIAAQLSESILPQYNEFLARNRAQRAPFEKLADELSITGVRVIKVKKSE